MVSKSHTLDWTSADCLLVWHSPKTYRKPEDIYLRLWGLIQTINTTEAQYLQQLQSSKSKARSNIINKLLQAKRQHYPHDHYPLISFHPTKQSYHAVSLKSQLTIAITLCFGGIHSHFANDWLHWFNIRLQLENTGFSLQNTPKLSYHQVTLPPLTARKLSEVENAFKNNDEMTLLIDTPANFEFNKTLQKQLMHASVADRMTHALMANSKKRLLQWLPEQQAVIEQWFNDWQTVLLASPVNWYQLHARHGIQTESKSSDAAQGIKSKQSGKSANQTSKIQFHKGHAGWLTLKGAWTCIPKLWQVLASSHLLGQRSQINGLGYFLQEAEFKHAPPTLWQRHITDKQKIHAAVDEVLIRYELEAVIDDAGKIMEEQALTNTIYTQLSTHTYSPQPSHAINIPKPHGGTRRIEELTQFDLMVHKLVFHAIAPITEKYQSPLSLGYRKGYSRQMARDKVNQIIQAGFTWVIEADIEAFFDNVPHEALWQRLALILPKREQQTLDLIKTLMQVPYQTSSARGHNVTTHTRKQGLMQGSPLSPVLANLYLATLDKQINTEHIAFVRYADDVLIFCRSQSNADSTLQWLDERLNELGLTLSLSKSAITPVVKGFEFLGYRFDKEGSEDAAIVPILRQRKPIMVSGNRKYLGVNGGALEIREKRARKTKGRSLKNSPLTNQLIQVIPLRRISQLVIIGNHAISSPLLAACATENVSVHVVNRWGFQIGTFTPSNAQFYAVSAKQYKRFETLKPSERLAIASDLILAKINNYQTWISNSYRKGDAVVIKKLNQISEQASSSTTIDALMGYEGQAAKLCFKRLQAVIISDQQSTFSSRRRSRGGVDRLNSLLNFGYYWLFTRISSLLHSHGLNPYLSYLHTPEQSYETLVYDLMELFRVQVDKTVLRLINRKQIQADSFHMHPKKGWQLNGAALHLYSNQLQATFASKINHTYIDDIILMQVRTVLSWAVEGQSLVWFYWYSDKDNVEFVSQDDAPQMINVIEPDNSFK